MKYFFAVVLAMLTGTAYAYEYPLQFTPNPGARGLVVAGYSFNGSTVLGNCSYYTVHGGSGRGGGYRQYTTHYNQTCTWDLFGNLLSITPGAPIAPAPLYVNGTQTVYGQDSVGDYTGTDSTLSGRGFVNTLGAHYKWTTPNSYTVLQQQAPYTVTAALLSDGDFPLDIAGTEATALSGTVAVQSTTCNGEIGPGSTCSVTAVYNPAKLCSATGLAYDTLTISVNSNAGQAFNFVQSYTIVVKTCDD